MVLFYSILFYSILFHSIIFCWITVWLMPRLCITRSTWCAFSLELRHASIHWCTLKSGPKRRVSCENSADATNNLERHGWSELQFLSCQGMWRPRMPKNPLLSGWISAEIKATPVALESLRSLVHRCRLERVLIRPSNTATPNGVW